MRISDWSSDVCSSDLPARNLAKRESGDAGRRMIADRRAKQPSGRPAKPAVAAEHQDLCGGLVDDREWIALAVVGCDHPARELDHRAGDLLVLRKLVDGSDRRGGRRAERSEAHTSELQPHMRTSY